MSEPRVSEQDQQVAVAILTDQGHRLTSDVPGGLNAACAAVAAALAAARQAAEQRAERWKREAMAHRAFYDFDDPDDDAGYQSVLVEREVSRAANEAAEREDAARREQDK